MKNLFLLFCFSVVSFAAMTQGFDKALQQSSVRIDSSFATIAKRINQYYDTATAGNRAGYKQWKRWEWFAAHHQTTSGKLDNYLQKNIEALTVEAKHSALSLQSYNGNWQSIGHTNAGGENGTALQGRVNCIAFDPINSQVMYAGASGGGIWKTTNGGELWYNVTATLPALGISDIVVAPWPNNNTIYALTGEGLSANVYLHKGFGCIKSTDGGNTWQLANKGMTDAIPDSGSGGYKLLMHPNNPDRLLAAMNNGIYETTNGAQSWRFLQTGLSRNTNDIEFKPDDPNVLYITRLGDNQLHIYDFNTRERTTTQVTTAAVNRMEIGISANRPNAVYVLAGPGSQSGNNNIFVGLFYRTNTTESFSAVATSLASNVALMNLGSMDIGFYANTLYVNPSNADDVFVGSVALARSTNGGSTLTQITSTNIHADQHDLKRHPLTGDLWLCNDGGIYTSTNGGASFTSKSNGLVITEIYRYSSITGALGKHLIGTQDNGHFRYNSTANPAWKFVLGGDGMDNLVNSINPAVMYACQQNGLLRRSADGGETFYTVPNIPDYGSITVYPWITPIVQHPPQSILIPVMTLNPETIYMYSNNGILVLVNNGQTVYNIGPIAMPAAEGIAPSMAIASNDGGATASLYMSNGSRIWVNNNPLQNSTANWTEIFWPTTAGTNIAALAVNPANKQDISIALSGYTPNGKVFRSFNAGVTWVNVSNGLPNVPMYSIAYANATNDNVPALYVGSEIGVYYYNINMAGWTPFSNNLPRVPITDLQVDHTLGRLVAASYGRGLWSGDLYQPCPDTHAVNTIMNGGQYHFESSNQTNTAATIIGGVNTMVTFKAGNRVVFTPGFSATGGVYLKAVNGPCGSGSVLPFLPAPILQQP
ncbi:MAG: hypothetical protein IT252_12950 [Chitinophagaceae bacterium]|nr:hypothetical protein [Chitinophagaceae bacterium]